MGTLLITGASGFVGSRLLERLVAKHYVVALSRGPVSGAHAHVQGTFYAPEILSQLDKYRFDAMVHLAAETGGCSEEAGLAVNVDGTRALLRYLADRGCRHYILASSIAAAGVLSPDFIPQQVPISDDHPCQAVDAYGLSKALMEEVTCYFHRLYPAFEYTMFRIGVVLAEDAEPVDENMLARIDNPFAGTACIAVQDVLTTLQHAVENPLRPGIERINLVGRYARTPLPVIQTFSRLLGDRARNIDFAYYTNDQTAHDGIFRIDRLRTLYGFTPTVDVRTMTETRRASPDRPQHESH